MSSYVKGDTNEQLYRACSSGATIGLFNESTALNINFEMLKQTAGGDMMSCRPLYGHVETFKPYIKWHLLSNEPPIPGAQHFAVWRRMLLVPWAVKFIDIQDPMEVEICHYFALVGIL